MADDGVMAKALEWVVDVDVPALRASVAALREKHPHSSNSELSKMVFTKSIWKATATGVATGLPANPWVAAPAAVADVAIVLRLEVLATAQVALIHDPAFFDDDEAQWELLVPVFGLNVAGQVVREMAVRGGMGVTRQLIRGYLSKETLKQFQKIMLKYFGLKVTQRAVITKTLPVVGGLIGGAWNFGEVTLLRTRAINYFDGKEMVA